MRLKSVRFARGSHANWHSFPKRPKLRTAVYIFRYDSLSSAPCTLESTPRFLHPILFSTLSKSVRRGAGEDRTYSFVDPACNPHGARKIVSSTYPYYTMDSGSVAQCLGLSMGEGKRFKILLEIEAIGELQFYFL